MLLDPVRRIHLYIFPLPLGIVAISFVIFEAIIVYFKPENLSGVAENVANIAHLGGVLTGSIFAFFNNPKRATKGLAVLIICVFLLVFLSPVFAMISLIGGFVLNVIDSVVGFVLYGIANLISPFWK